MTASFDQAASRTTLTVGDPVSVEFVGPPGGVRAKYGVGRVTKSPVRSDDDRYEVQGVSGIGPFRRDFPRSDLTRLVPEKESIEFPEPPDTDYRSALKALRDAANKIVAEMRVPRYYIDPEFPTRQDVVAAFKNYLSPEVGPDELDRRRVAVADYLGGAGVRRVVDLKPEQFADAFVFVKKQNAASIQTPEGRHVDDREAQTPEPSRAGAGYDPHRLTNCELQLAIDNVMKVIRGGVGPNINAGKPETICALLEDHLADLLEIQRERAGGEG